VIHAASGMNPIVVDGHVPVIEIARERIPAFEAAVQLWQSLPPPKAAFAVQPSIRKVLRRFGPAPAKPAALIGIQNCSVAPNVVMSREVRHDPSSDLTTVIGVQVEELAPCVRGTTNFSDASLEASLLSAVIVAHELAPPAGDECTGVFAYTPDGEVVNHSAKLAEVREPVRP
jgi:hypothetical protein